MYLLAPTLEKVGTGPVGLRFASPYAEKGDPFVFPSPAATLDVQGVNATGTAFLIDVIGPDPGVDLSATPVNAARLILEYGPGAAPGEYRVRLDPINTFLGTAAVGQQIHIQSADVSDVGVIRLVPEPGALSLLAAAAVPGLRRRVRT
jgi:hypothetical protein